MVRKRLKPQPRKFTRHDAFAKFGFKDPLVLVPFLKSYLPSELQKGMVFESLRYESENLVHKILGTRVADVLVSIPYKQSKALIFILIEHLRRPLRVLPFRTFAMAFMILEQWLKIQKHIKPKTRAPKLPVVFPIVFYNGCRPYNGPLSLADLFQDPELFTKVLNGPITMVDTNTVEIVRSEGDGRNYVFQQMMKHISTGQLSKILLEMIPEMRKIEEEEEGSDYLTSLFRYALTSATRIDPQEILAISGQFEGGTTLKTALQILIEREVESVKKESASAIASMRAELEDAKRNAEVEAKEAKQTLFESARTMLQEGLSVEMVARFLKLPLAQIQELAP